MFLFYICIFLFYICILFNSRDVYVHNIVNLLEPRKTLKMMQLRDFERYKMKDINDRSGCKSKQEKKRSCHRCRHRRRHAFHSSVKNREFALRLANCIARREDRNFRISANTGVVLFVLVVDGEPDKG